MKRFLIAFFIILLKTQARNKNNCQYDQECKHLSEKNLYCHPIHHLCTECSHNSHCPVVKPHCSWLGKCSNHQDCSSDVDCQQLKQHNGCASKICTLSHNHQKFAKPSRSRKMGVDTTNYADWVSNINSYGGNSQLSQNEDLIYFAALKLGFTIANVSDIYNPYIVTNYDLCQEGYDVQLSADEKILYLLSLDNVCIFDISNLANPKLLSQTTTYGGKTFFLLSTKPLLIFGSYADSVFVIMNVSNPRSPTIVSTTPLFANPSGLTFTMKEDIVFVVGDNGINILNISNPVSPHVIASNSSIFGYNLFLSPDEQTAYLAGAYLIIADFSNYASLQIISKTELLAYASDLMIQPDQNMIFISEYNFGTRIYDYTNPAKPILYANLISGLASSVTASADFLTFFIGDQLDGIDVFTQPQFSSTMINDLVGASLVTQFDNYPINVVLSSDESFAFITEKSYGLQVVNITDPFNPFIASFVNLTNGGNVLEISPDYQHIFLTYYTNPNGVLVYDVSNPLSPSHITTIAAPNPYFIKLSNDGTKIAISDNTDGVLVYDITTINSPVKLLQYNYPGIRFAIPSKTPGILFYTEQFYFSSLDYTTPSSPKVLSSLVCSDAYDILLNDAELIAYVADGKNGIRTVDIHNINNIVTLDRDILQTDAYRLWFNQDQTIIYASDFDPGIGVYVIDVSVTLDPIIIGLIRTAQARMARSSVDHFFLYVADSTGGFKVFNTQSQYVVRVTDPLIELGIENGVDFLVGNLQTTSYAPFSQLYKYIKISILTFEIDPITTNVLPIYSSVPDWITEDLDNGQLSFFSSSSGDIGTYYLFVAFGIKVDFDALIGIGNITDSVQASIVANDELLGVYIDGEGYLTTFYNPTVPLIMDDTYTSIEPQIRNALSQFYVQSVETLLVKDSLNITTGTDRIPNYITFNTPSQNTMIFSLSLFDTKAVFMDINYDSSADITVEDSQTIVIGSQFDLNDALYILRIDLEGINNSAGNVTLHDSLNPDKEIYYPNLTAYFRINRAPQLNISLQPQINGNDIYTAQEFSFEFDPNSFYDPDGDILYYTLKTTDGSEVPGWIKSNDLSLSGTPPSQFNYEITLLIFVTDKYKNTSSTFTIKVKPSATFLITYLIQFIGPLAGVIGLYVYAIEIYNILFKSLYTCPKEFIIKPNQQVNSLLIYPIALTQTYKEESLKIIEAYNRLIRDKQKGKNSKEKPKSLSTKDIKKLFADNLGVIDNSKIMDMIDEIREAFPTLSLPLYSQGSNFTKPSIQREKVLAYLHDTFTLSLIKTDKKTYRTFNHVKNSWAMIIQPCDNLDDLEFPSNFDFKINEEYLLNLLLNLKISDFPKSHPENSLSKGGLINENKKNKDKKSKKIHPSFTALPNNPTSMSDISYSDLNMELLNQALLAYARRKYNLSFEDIKIDIKSFKVAQGDGCVHNLRKFLKMDQEEMSYTNKNNVGYGVKYKLENDMIYFYGKTFREIEGVALAFTILTKKQMILREIMIHGGLEDEAKKVIQIESERESLIKKVDKDAFSIQKVGDLGVSNLEAKNAP